MNHRVYFVCVCASVCLCATHLLKPISWKYKSLGRVQSVALALPPPSLPPTLLPPSFSFTHTPLLLSHWNGLVQAVAEQPSSADVGTTCGWLCCMLPGSDPPPCTPLPFCGISCTSATSTPFFCRGFCPSSPDSCGPQHQCSNTAYPFSHLTDTPLSHKAEIQICV